jgi:hypothetical protein
MHTVLTRVGSGPTNQAHQAPLARRLQEWVGRQPGGTESLEASAPTQIYPSVIVSEVANAERLKRSKSEPTRMLGRKSIYKTTSTMKTKSN